MENTSTQEAGSKWLSVPIIAMITRLLCRELTLQNEYLRSKGANQNYSERRFKSATSRGIKFTSIFERELSKIR